MAARSAAGVILLTIAAGLGLCLSFKSAALDLHVAINLPPGYQLDSVNGGGGAIAGWNAAGICGRGTRGTATLVAASAERARASGASREPRKRLIHSGRRMDAISVSSPAVG